MQFISKKISIAPLGITDHSLPILTAGIGGPRVLIINNLHGDELTGYFVLEKLLSLLPEKINGTINIVVSANPMGLIHRQRFLPIDNVDLNRDYPNVVSPRGIAGALREKLSNLALNHDFIIDLHTFAKPCLSAGLLVPQADEKKDILIRRCLNVSNTDITIKMNIKGGEKRVGSALGIFLIEQEKPFLVLEYNPIRQINEENILANYAQGLINIFSVLGLIKQELNINNKNLELFERQQLISSNTGLFVPQKKLGEKIKTNEIIGYLINLKNLSHLPVVSPYEGIVTEIADRQLYLYGDKLATIGKKVL